MTDGLLALSKPWPGPGFWGVIAMATSLPEEGCKCVLTLMDGHRLPGYKKPCSESPLPLKPLVPEERGVGLQGVCPDPAHSGPSVGQDRWPGPSARLGPSRLTGDFLAPLSPVGNVRCPAVPYSFSNDNLSLAFRQPPKTSFLSPWVSGGRSHLGLHIRVTWEPKH